MTERCELCNRAYAQGAVTPYWWPYSNLCDRKHCRQARDDALLAVIDSRERFEDLVGSIRKRYQSNGTAVGYRTDAFAKFDMDDEDWWALSIAKDPEKP